MDETDQAAAGPDPGPAQQTVFWGSVMWWMVSLSLNAIAQDTGNVFSMRTSHSAVIRALPLAYTFDALDALGCWIVDATQDGITIRRAATYVLKRRFVDVDGHPDLVAIRKAREQSKGRWLGFGLGVLPNFIKICACSGIPGTLLYSSMFVAPWVAFELLILIGDPSQPSSLDGSRVQSPPSLSRRLWALWGVTIASIFPVYSPAYNPKQIPYQELQLVSYNMLGALCIGFILSLAASTVFIDFRDNQGDLVVVTWTILLLGCFLQFLGTVLVGKGILSLYSNLEAVVIGVVSLFFTYRNAYPIARAMIRGRLQTVASSQALHGVFAVLSIYTLLSWIFWYYAVFFDETDTYMPDWLKYLG